MRDWRKWAVFIASTVVSCVFIINLCNGIFGCGCRSLWAGAVDHCNIHTPGVRHCPWCATGNAGFAVVLLGIVVPQGFLSFWPAAWSWARRLLFSLAAFPIAGAILGVAFGLGTGYWK